MGAGCSARGASAAKDPVQAQPAEPAAKPAEAAAAAPAEAAQPEGLASSTHVKFSAEVAAEEPAEEKRESHNLEKKRDEFMSDVGHSFKGAKAKINAEMEAAFKKIDVDGSGTIDKEEFGKILLQYPDHFTQEDIDAIYAEADADGNGDISYAEFTVIYDELQESLEEAKEEAEAAGAQA